MPQRCTICNNPYRAAIEQEIQDHTPLTRVAAAFGVSRSSLQRHRDHPLTQIVIRTAAISEQLTAAKLLERLEEAYHETASILDAAQDNRTRLRAIRRIEDQIELALALHTRTQYETAVQTALNRREAPQITPKANKTQGAENVSNNPTASTAAA